MTLLARFRAVRAGTGHLRKGKRYGRHGCQDGLMRQLDRDQRLDQEAGDGDPCKQQAGEHDAMQRGEHGVEGRGRRAHPVELRDREGRAAGSREYDERDQPNRAAHECAWTRPQGDSASARAPRPGRDWATANVARIPHAAVTWSPPDWPASISSQAGRISNRNAPSQSAPWCRWQATASGAGLPATRSATALRA